MRDNFGNMLDIVHLPPLTKSWDLETSFQDCKEVINNAINNIKSKYKDLIHCQIDVIVGQRQKPHEYAGEISGECVDNDYNTCTLVILLHSYDKERLRAVVTHEMMHVICFEPGKRERSDRYRIHNPSYVSKEDRLLEISIEEGLAEALVFTEMGIENVDKGNSDFIFPDDIKKLGDWRDKNAAITLELKVRDPEMFYFLVSHKHYSTGFYIVKFILEQSNFDLHDLIITPRAEIWDKFLELSSEKM